MPSVFFVVVFLVLNSAAQAFTINRLNGGASVVYVDFSIPSGVVPVDLVRTYNSITALNETSGWNGAFGWGWTSPFETTLTVTPDRHVLLRDGGSGNTIIFRPEKEDPKIRDEFYDAVKHAYFDRKAGKKVPDAEIAKMQLPEKFLSRLKNDPQFRIEVSLKFNVKSTVPRGELLVSSEYGYQTMQFKNNQWLRDKDGVTQVFDGEGRIVRQKDKNGFYIDFKYSPTQKMQVSEISSQDRGTSMKFTWRLDRIAEIIDNRGHRGKYQYDNLGNLIHVTDSTAQTFVFKYENKKFPHLLTRVDYISESKMSDRVYRELKYDDNGLVVYHREKDASEFLYSYGKKSNDPENNFWTKTVKKTKSGSEEIYDEYFIRARADGSKYLYKQDSKQNGVTTLTLFTACCGKPTQIVKNGEVTNFKYYENGLLSERVGPNEDVKVEYDPRWKKVTKVNQNGFVSNYSYDDRGNLVKATNTKKQQVAMKYDKFGRILDMVDSDGRQIDFKYGENGKPNLITEKGVGTIRIAYDGDGRITKTETITSREKGRKPSEAHSQEVIKRVMKGFQTLLDIIRPAGVNLVSQ